MKDSSPTSLEGDDTLSEEEEAAFEQWLSANAKPGSPAWEEEYDRTHPFVGPDDITPLQNERVDEHWDYLRRFVLPDNYDPWEWHLDLDD